MRFHALGNVSTSLLEVYVEQVFLIPLPTWTPEDIRREDGPESFRLFISYSIEWGALQLSNNNSYYEYCGPLDWSEEAVEAATEADILRYRRFIVPDWALGDEEPWLYENRKQWVSSFHFYRWKHSQYSRAYIYPIHHNFVPEDRPARMDTGDVCPKYGVWFYLQDFTATFPLVIPVYSANPPVDFRPTDCENTIAWYGIFPKFVHYLSSFMRQYPRDLPGDVSAFIDYYADMQPAYIAPAGTEFTKAYVKCGEYSCVVKGFWAQTCGNGLAPVAEDPMIPMKYMSRDLVRLPEVRPAIEYIYKRTMAEWLLH